MARDRQRPENLWPLQRSTIGPGALPPLDPSRGPLTADIRAKHGVDPANPLRDIQRNLLGHPTDSIEPEAPQPLPGAPLRRIRDAESG